MHNGGIERGYSYAYSQCPICGDCAALSRSIICRSSGSCEAKMKIVAIMPARNEDWVLGLSARALLRWVDKLVILDHCSTDESRQLEWGLAIDYDPEQVSVMFENDPTWEEMRHRQRLLEYARHSEATHIVTIDADEVVSANLVPHMRDIVADIPPGHVLQLPWIT